MLFRNYANIQKEALFSGLYSATVNIVPHKKEVLLSGYYSATVLNAKKNCHHANFTFVTFTVSKKILFKMNRSVHLSPAP